MTERDKMLLAKSYVEMLARGRNPLTGESVQRDSVLNAGQIVRCLFYVAELIENYAIECDENGALLPSRTRAERRTSASIKQQHQPARPPQPDTPHPSFQWRNGAPKGTPRHP